MARTQATPAEADGSAVAPRRGESYTVVARRYRPQTFEDVVGQDHVVEALRNAIRLNRIAHAYLFCGTRGVGKTSMARIFAKALNCVKGPTIHPCRECDICQAIATGEDVDVIEIDGASNNGVDAVRDLRANAGLRPSRSRFKIYYIDEVHMLSTGAFNALLKILEEPPEHVKFLFATTESHKIPITVLSRCQRFDFAPITPESIAETLAEICGLEGVDADADALRTIARRAAGSMRDAQSLLERLLSSGDRKVTVEDVHRILGTAADERVLELLEALADRDPARALLLVDRAVSHGIQAPDLLGGALEFLRDAMVVAVGGSEVELVAATPAERPRLQNLADRWGLDAILAAVQILDQARGRLRGNPLGRITVEIAVVKVARLDDMTELGGLVQRLAALESGTPLPPAPNRLVAAPPTTTPAPEKKKLEPAPESVIPASPALTPAPPPRPAPAIDAARPLSLDAVETVWADFLAAMGKGLESHLRRLHPSAIFGPDRLVLAVESGYNWAADRCEAADVRVKLESTLSGLLGRSVTVAIERPRDDSAPPPSAGPKVEDLQDDPFVQKVVELFEARPIRVEADDR